MAAKEKRAAKEKKEKRTIRFNKDYKEKEREQKEKEIRGLHMFAKRVIK